MLKTQAKKLKLKKLRKYKTQLLASYPKLYEPSCTFEFRLKSLKCLYSKTSLDPINGNLSKNPLGDLSLSQIFLFHMFVVAKFGTNNAHYLIFPEAPMGFGFCKEFLALIKCFLN